MFKNRFLIVLGVLSLLLVAMVISFPLSNTPTSAEGDRAADATRWQAMGEYYANQADAQRLKGDQPYVLDSATHSYIAWGQAMQVRNALDSGTRSYIAWGEALEKAKRNALDSGTRSYIAWGEALQAAGKLSDSNACSNTTLENIFVEIPNNVDSGTRSYIAWGLALQGKNDIPACR